MRTTQGQICKLLTSRADFGDFEKAEAALHTANTSGEGGIRTRDTTIFSRVLYQLSYLASARERPALREG